MIILIPLIWIDDILYYIATGPENAYYTKVFLLGSMPVSFFTLFWEPIKFTFMAKGEFRLPSII
jgi:hypothetical protein